MLQLLHIENIAVIECADILFRPGFNALTGETGAGKSIVIDALSAVMGQRTSRDLIRTGAAKAFVSAQFDAVADAHKSLLAENGIEVEEDGILLLQRDIYADGRNACRANGRPITVAQLRTVGSALLNIHGQHDGQQLLDEEQHGRYLDLFGRIDLAPYCTAYEAMRSTRGRIEALRMDEAEKARRIDMLRHQIAELERAELRDGEEEELLSRRKILRGGEKLLSSIRSADQLLNGGDESLGAVSLLREAENAMRNLRAYEESFETICTRLENVRCEVYDLAETIRDMKERYDFSPQELDAVEERADLLYRLEKKYGATVADMLAYLEKCRVELDEIEYADDQIAALEKKLAAQREETLRQGALLTAARRAAAAQLEEKIMQELGELDMGRVRFAIELKEKAPETDGMDSVRFLMSANLGEELKAIDKIASGGELARIMLAMKNVFSEQESVMTMVFDEVDTGVSGRAAQRVAEKMAKLSRRKQVLCVTHLPQLAAMADTHFSVEKGERDGRTYTQVTCLDEEERCMELSRLTGGIHVTKTQIEGAQELLAAAQEYKRTALI